MPQIIFRGTVVDSVRFWSNSGLEVELNMISDWTEPVRSAMKWGEPAEGHGKSDLCGKLQASNLVLTPNHKELKEYELNFPISSASAFKHVPRLDKEGNVKSREIHWKVTCGDPDVVAHLANYTSKIGDAPAQCRVNYNEVVQEEIPVDPPPVEKPRGRRGAEVQ